MSSKDIQLIMIDKMFHSVVPKSSEKVYEIYVASSGYLNLEFFSCQGPVEVFTANDYKHFLNNDLDSLFTL